MSVLLQLTLTFDPPGKKHAINGAIKSHIIIIITKDTAEEGAQKHIIYSLCISKVAT